MSSMRWISKDWKNREYAFVSDIDGVLACNEHRLPLLRQAEPDFHGYDALCIHDPVLPTAQILRDVHASHKVVLVSSRNMNVREATQRWLQEHEIPFDELRMRNPVQFNGDRFHEFKPHVLGQLQLKYNIVNYFEDHPPTVERILRDHPGLPVTLVHSGYYDQVEVAWED